MDGHNTTNRGIDGQKLVDEILTLSMWLDECTNNRRRDAKRCREDNDIIADLAIMQAVIAYQTVSDRIDGLILRLRNGEFDT